MLGFQALSRQVYVSSDCKCGDRDMEMAWNFDEANFSLNGFLRGLQLSVLGLYRVFGIICVITIDG